MTQLALGLLVPLVLTPAAAQAQDMLAGPAEAIDGRSLSIGGTVIRLADIDAPDLDRNCAMEGRNYPCGRLARAALADLLTGAQTECRIVGRPVGTPPLAECLADGFDLSLNMVHTGWAYADAAQSNRYTGIENSARTARRGLWRGEFERPTDRGLAISGE
ncbi:MAG: thermonuclease family protein [Proteobacteria bacterium]|nr:thermonuclease family protein [Pseudomonadota bacterium]